MKGDFSMRLKTRSITVLIVVTVLCLIIVAPVCGATKTLTKTLYCGYPPNPSFSQAGDMHVGSVQSFTDTSTAGDPTLPVVQVIWVITNMDTGTDIATYTGTPGSTFTYIFPSAGNYRVRLTAVNSCGAQNSFELTWNVKSACPPSPPTAQFSATPTSGPAPLTVHITDQSGSGATHTWWKFGDGNEDASIPVGWSGDHTYTVPNTYTITLTAYDVCSHQDVFTKTITVTAPAPATGSIFVNSNPPSATVLVDDVPQSGTTPLTIPLVSTGSHTVLIRKSGYDDYSTSAQVTAGGTATVIATLTQSSSSTGTLVITSIPDGAAVYIDGGSQGTTPTTISITAGSHTVRLTKSGYTDYQQPAITVAAGNTIPLNVNLVAATGPTSTTPATGTGSISIISSPAGASVNLDGWDKGTTPVTIPQVKAGSHTLTLKKAGYTDKVGTIVVEGGQITSVTITLIPEGQNPSAFGTLTIRSTPAGANVYFDGEKVENTPVTLQNVPSGSHKVLLTMQNYGDYSQTVDIASGSDKEISVALPAVTATKTPGFAAPVSLAALVLVSLVLLGRRKER